MIRSLFFLAAGMFAMGCDDYVVKAGGAERLHKTPQEVLVIPC